MIFGGLAHTTLQRRIFKMTAIGQPVLKFFLWSAFSILMTGAIASSCQAGVVLANLRSDYDRAASTFSNGQSATIADTLGTGSWNFYARSNAAPGGSQSSLVYSTTANSVRNANAFVYNGGSSLNLPGISNTQLISGSGEGTPDSTELALHPGDGNTGTANFVVLRWTAGAGEAGQVNLKGGIRDLGVVVDGVTFQIYNSAGTSLFGSVTTSGNTPVNFDINTTIAVGGYVDFVVGKNGNYFSDQSGLSINVTAVPEPSPLALSIFALLLAIVARYARKGFHQFAPCRAKTLSISQPL